MRALILSLLCGLATSAAHASRDLNHIGCVYSFNGEEWIRLAAFNAVESFHLENGQMRMLSAGWTSDKPVGSNYAFCTAMVGTDNDDSVSIETYRYRANAFQRPGPKEDCSVTGSNVELISKDVYHVERGSFAELEIDWLPPKQQKLRIREYFPLKSELDSIDEIVSDKCKELNP
jgi:hypothetical protein